MSSQLEIQKKLLETLETIQEMLRYQQDSSYFVKEKMESYIGKPIGIRHHLSGVWLGLFRGQSFMKNAITIEGRRIWSWSGGQLEFSQLCSKGVTENEVLGDLTVQDIPVGPGDRLVELTFQVPAKHIEKLFKMPESKT